MTILLVTCANGREGDAALELEWALEDARVKKTKWKGVLLCFTQLKKEEALKRIEEFETSAIFRVMPIDELVESSKEVIVEHAFKLAAERIHEGDSFAVRCKKRGGRIKSEKEMERELGAKIKESLKATVNLSDPEWLVLIEVIDKKTGIGVLRADEVIKKEVEI